MPQSLIELIDIDLTLGAGAARVHVLKKLSLNIARGETIGLVGPSGSGKSTLLMTLAGLERPDSGAVLLDGRDLTKLDEDALARFRGENIGIVFQSFQLIPTMTALENVAAPLELAGRARRLCRAPPRNLPRSALASAFRIIRASFPAASSSASRWRGRWPPTRSFWRRTSPPAISIRTPAPPLSTLSSSKRPGATRRWCWSRTTPALAARCDRVVRLRSGRIETPRLGTRDDCRATRFSRQDFRWRLRFALRDLIGDPRGFGVFIACIVIGVAAISGVNGLSRALSQGLAREGRAILGGDVSFNLAHRELEPERTRLSGAARPHRRNRADARNGETRKRDVAEEADPALIEIKAVDPAVYPSFGALETEPPTRRRAGSRRTRRRLWPYRRSDADGAPRSEDGRPARHRRRAI